MTAAATHVRRRHARRRRFAAAHAALKLTAMVLVSAVLMPAQTVLLRCSRGPTAYRMPRLWHRCLCAILGLKVEVVGTRYIGGPTLFVGNHVSHFDILAIGSALPASFIAKDDMERWPGIAFVAGLQQTVFVSRRARDAAAVAAQVGDAMRRGNHLVLFAEGTTSNGATVAPFKSSLFALVAGGGNGGGDGSGSGSGSGSGGAAAWTIQPFTIDLREVDGLPLCDDADRDGYAFYGDMDAGAHVHAFLRSRGARIRLVLHTPIRITAELSRKALASQAHTQVAAAITSLPGNDARAPDQPADGTVARAGPTGASECDRPPMNPA
ncbi:MAG: lysophospholipid acyltransferase family protein [Luteimonas sp.]